MFTNIKTQAFDGDYEIIFSDVFNVYQNKLLITDIIAGFSFEFNFKVNKEIIGSTVTYSGDNETKKVTIDLFNFNNSLGVGLTKPFSILNTDDNKEVLFSIHSKSLSETTPFLQVSITFYLKQNESKG